VGEVSLEAPLVLVALLMLLTELLVDDVVLDKLVPDVARHTAYALFPCVALCRVVQHGDAVEEDTSIV
jgi:hypothetical protein